MDKTSRPVRNRKHSRFVKIRAWTPGEVNHPVKRLFTPEIKRMLKDWLVRRRENPYPSREEKKSLAVKTGLTYIQICNWFANWRRKLKNAGKEPQKNTWGHLIKNYNTNAHGNVEQFSICSGDSIWEDEERQAEYFEQKLELENSDDYHPNSNVYFDGYHKMDTNYEPVAYGPNGDCDDYIKDETSSQSYGNKSRKSSLESCISREQCYQVSSTTNNNNSVIQVNASENSILKSPLNCFSNAKYKNQIMEKYLRGLDDSEKADGGKCGLELSKWLESTANFTPDKNNYIEWESRRIRSKQDDFQDQGMDTNLISLHQKEELDAAEALTFLAGNCKNRLIK